MRHVEPSGGVLDTTPARQSGETIRDDPTPGVSTRPWWWFLEPAWLGMKEVGGEQAI